MSTPEYKKATYDRIGLVVRKGKRAEYQQAADDFGTSLSEMIKLAIEEYIAHRSYESPRDLPANPAPPTPKLTAEEKSLLAEFNQLPADLRKAILKTFKAINAELDRNRICACK